MWRINNCSTASYANGEFNVPVQIPPIFATLFMTSLGFEGKKFLKKKVTKI
jgi:hypothetical protein